MVANVTGEENAHGPTGTQTQDLSQTVRALWPLSYQATRSTMTISRCLIRFVPESARNHAGTDETVLFAARSPSTDQHWPPNVTGEENAHGPTGTRIQDLSQTVRALWPLSYRATLSTCNTCTPEQRTNFLREATPALSKLFHLILVWLGCRAKLRKHEQLQYWQQNNNNKNIE